MHPILRIIWAGVYDEESVLNCLLGKPHLIQQIWRFYVEYMEAHIHLPNPILYIEPEVFEEKAKDGFLDIPDCNYWLALTDVTFPKPQDLDIYMMPFLHSYSFRHSGLPKTVKPYWDFVERLMIAKKAKTFGQIWYLTIHEGWVEAGESQQRPGLHIDNPGPLQIQSSQMIYDRMEGDGKSFKHFFPSLGEGFPLRNGCTILIEEGIYMASNVSEVCKVWDCKVDTEIVGDMGDLEHARNILCQKEINSFKLYGNMLYWITDKTPHEFLPLKERTYRQFFRVVTENVSLWFEDHSTPNPNGIKPNPKLTKIVKGNKFDPSSLVITESVESNQSSKLRKFLKTVKF